MSINNAYPVHIAKKIAGTMVAMTGPCGTCRPPIISGQEAMATEREW